MTNVPGHTKSSFLRDLLPWFLGVIVVLIGIGTAKQALKRYQIQSEINAMQNSVTDLQTQNGQLLQILSYVKSPAYAEEQARLQFGMAKPGEHLAVIPEGTVLGASTTAQTDSDASNAKNNTSNKWQWWNYFFSTSK